LPRWERGNDVLSDEEYGAALLRPLDREPTRPSTVDVMRAVEDARRYRRRAGLAGVAGVVAATALVVTGGVTVVGWGRQAPTAVGTRPPAASAMVTPPSPSPSAPAGPTACTMQRLPVPAGQPPKSVVTGGDPTGRYILGRSYPGGQSHPLLIWDNGQVRTVAMQGDDQELVDITSTGTVAVGSSFIGDKQVAWVYRDGVTSRLPGGDNAYASGVNDQGVIAGAIGDEPAMWRSATSAPTMLSLPGPGWTGSVDGIDEDGTMVGEVMDGQDLNSRVGYLWHPDGTGERLPVPVANGKPVTSYLARAIRGDWAVGWASQDAGRGTDIYAPRWNLRTGEVDVTSFPGVADAINAQGWIAGEVRFSAAVGGGGAPLALPDLGSDEPAAANIAYTVSDDGAVSAGQVQSANGDPVAVEWHCH
jgi:hypothetical protein